MNNQWCYVFCCIFVLGAASCSSKTKCGGNIYPKNPGDAALELVKKTAIEAETFCAGSPSGCDFTVARTKKGWSVAANRTFPVNGKCASRIGDEKFYSYDESGILIKVLDGL